MIGVLDSGVGGLSFYNEIKKSFPTSSIIYLGDEENFPYGTKTVEDLCNISLKNIRTLEKYGAKIILIACNSVTVSAISYLREKSSTPIIGVEPAIKVASANTKNGKIGILATKRTVKSHINENLHTKDQTLVLVPEDALVEAVENDFDSITDAYLTEIMKDFVEKEVDSIVLGCTHFIFLKKRLEGLFPDVEFYEPIEAVVRRIKYVLDENGIKTELRDDLFLTTGDASLFKKKTEILLNLRETNVQKV